MKNENKSLEEILNNIQVELKAPKSQYNLFGKYHYRKAEDIIEAVKLLLKDTNAVVCLSDEIIEVSGRIYVKATVSISNGEKSYSTTAFAREPSEQKGMNDAQLTGATSSYARKYALNGLFLCDDSQDADAQHSSSANKVTPAAARATQTKLKEQDKMSSIPSTQVRTRDGKIEAESTTLAAVRAKLDTEVELMTPAAWDAIRANLDMDEEAFNRWIRIELNKAKIPVPSNLGNLQKAAGRILFLASKELAM